VRELGHLRDEPVAPHLRGETTQPRTEVNPLRVELDVRALVCVAPADVVEILRLQVALRVAEVAAQTPGRE